MTGFPELVDYLYALVSALPRFGYETKSEDLPENGIYIFFEKGEVVRCQGIWSDRIVRVGTHREDGRFRTRIRQHYGNAHSLGGNKNGSVFRKHLGGALLRRSNEDDPRLRDWLKQDGPSFPEVEEVVSKVLRKNFSFCCFRVDHQVERLALERDLISLFARHPLGQPSANWLGKYAASEKIRRTGLWNTQHIDAEPLTLQEFRRFEELVRGTLAKVRVQMERLLIIVPCGQGKIWDKYPNAGPTPARDVYTGTPFKVNREYAARFAERWVILSAKYGFIHKSPRWIPRSSAAGRKAGLAVRREIG